MKKRISILLSIILIVLCCACTQSGTSSSFSILFMDVGQGDAALVECDGQYMLIDGGDVQHKDKVYQTLVEHVGAGRKLSILAMSHPHSDHIGGLEKAITSFSSIGLVLSNTDQNGSDAFRKVEEQLGIIGAKITVPHAGDTYALGSAKVAVIDVASTDPNDSLVLMITYGQNKFLFTGDIEYAGQKRIADKYQNEDDKEYKIDLMKMPHHGSSDGDIYRFVRTFMPDYAIISCGAGNPYNHPHQRTLDVLDNKAYSAQIYRTDLNGDITVKSDGKTLSVQTSK